MGKKRKQDGSETEHLRGLVRELKSENRHLKKRLGYSNKQIKHYEHYLEEADDEGESYLADHKEEAKTLSKELCPECNENIETIEVGNRLLYICSNCRFRVSKKFK